MDKYSFDSEGGVICQNFYPVDEDNMKRCKSTSFTLHIQRTKEEDSGEIELICNGCSKATKVF
jgi:hypothetical protein